MIIVNVKKLQVETSNWSVDRLPRMSHLIKISRKTFVATCSWLYGLMKTISRAARGAVKNTRQKSISSDNPRLTVRTSPEGDGPRVREGEHREELAKMALEIIVVITRSGRAATAGIKGKRGRKRKRVLSEDTISSRNVPGFYWEKTRERERESVIARATTVPQALISSIISFADAADRWWVRENERESISGNQPPRAAFCRSQEKKGTEMPRNAEEQ